jgi:Icc-related predicted phosphoesterase
MRVDLISDLHLEFGDLELPGGDVLIISGDACEARYLDKSSYGPDTVYFSFEDPRRKTTRFYRFFQEECSKYNRTLYVMGNHEHYGGQFEKTYDRLKNNLPDHVQLLEKETAEINGVLFIGSTLWTDMNQADELTMFHLKTGMNDYHVVKMQTNGNYHKLNPERTYREHTVSKEYIKIALDNNRSKAAPLPVVVVTHHAPSKLSIKPRYEKDTLMNGGYSSDLSELMLDYPEIRVWTHGHTHDEFRYQIGETTVICNPRGYYGHEPRANHYSPKGFNIGPDGVVAFDTDWCNE